MSDIYLKVANSQVGKSILEALNLPTPPDLERTPAKSLSGPTGKILLGYSPNSLAIAHVAKAFDNESVRLYTPEAKTSKGNAQRSPFKAPAKPKPVRLSSDSIIRFKTVIYDATGLKSISQLHELYEFFKPVLRGLKHGAKVVILGLDTSSCMDPQQAAVNASLEGFTKSVSKEIGYKGATCNLLQLQPSSERQLRSALYFLSSPKSAFVSGQIVKLEACPANRKKINFEQPLSGKVALVTGAAQGIGEVTAQTLARDGATVVCLDIPSNESKLKSLANKINGHSLAVDLSQKDAPEQIASTIASQLGLLDIIVHNAGITRDKTLGKMPSHFWDQVVNINLEKVVAINDLLIERKLFKNDGRIVCISSISGIAGNFGQTNYACSKSGVAGYVKSLSQNIDQGMTINAVAPGFIETQMTSKIPLMTRELGRRTSSLSQGGLPLDVAEAISFFCHPLSRAANGNVLRVCGQSLLGR